jgi:hypothetical protein
MNRILSYLIFFTLMCSTASAAVDLSEGVQINITNASVVIGQDMSFDDVETASNYIGFYDTFWSYFNVDAPNDVSITLNEYSMVGTERYSFTVSNSESSIVYYSLNTSTSSPYQLNVDGSFEGIYYPGPGNQISFHYSDYSANRTFTLFVYEEGATPTTIDLTEWTELENMSVDLWTAVSAMLMIGAFMVTVGYVVLSVNSIFKGNGVNVNTLLDIAMADMILVIMFILVPIIGSGIQ